MSNLAITYLGHASTIIQCNNLTVYTDPHFGPKALLFKRRRPVPIPPEDLPRPHAVLISHAHYDHLDLHSFKYIASTVPVLIPQGLSRLMDRFIQNPLIELTEGSDYLLRDNVRIRAVPVLHRGGRLTGIRYQQSTGFLIETEEGNIFFPGDTAYHPSLKELKQYGPLAAALLPVGPCHPQWMMQKRHLRPEQLLQLAEELEAQVVIPIHWGVFRLGLEPADRPLEWLKEQLADSPVKEKFVILEPGETWQAV